MGVEMGVNEGGMVGIGVDVLKRGEAVGKC